LAAPLILAFALAAAPVAAFSVSSPVAVGAPVSYVDQSYDPAPGHHLTLQIWIGRQGTFDSPGTYPVTLVVEDDRGLMASATHDVTVSRPAHHSPPPAPIAAAVTLSPSAVQRGDAFTVRVTGVPDAQGLEVHLPSSFLPAVTLPAGVLRYAQVNAASFSLQSGVWQATCWVPWTQGIPADGNYPISVTWTADGQVESASARLTVQGADRLAIWAEP